MLDAPGRFYALILSPTRELALQIKEQVEALGASISVRCAALVGGIDMTSQVSWSVTEDLYHIASLLGLPLMYIHFLTYHFHADVTLVLAALLFWSTLGTMSNTSTADSSFARGPAGPLFYQTHYQTRQLATDCMCRQLLLARALT